jgi:gliding motility-associated-like protein
LPAGSCHLLVSDQSGCTRMLGPLLVLADTMAFHNELDVNWCESSEYILPDGRTVREIGRYAIIYQRINGCDSTLVVNLEISKEEYFVPNIFSPNSDNLNDGFTVYGNKACIEAIQLLRIFDRWGNLLFEKHDFPTNQEKDGWDGRAALKDAPAGVYAYYCELRLYNGAVKKLSGDVTIVR